MATWTIVLKDPGGGIHFQEVEADAMDVLSLRPDAKEYRLISFSHEGGETVAVIPKSSALAVYEGRRTTFDVTLTPKDDEPG